MADTETIVTGPILFFRGLTGGELRLAALVVAEGEAAPPPLRVEGEPDVEPERLGGRLGRTVWRYGFGVPAGPEPVAVEYAIGSGRWRVQVPGADAVRVAFTACNGEAHDDDASLDHPDRNERWRHLAEEHARAPFHLLLQGGDQLYADDVWRRVGALADWDDRRDRDRRGWTAPAGLEEEIADFYFERYCRLWAQRDLAPLLASIPSLMIWDDHDIFDGWGSHAPHHQASEAFQTTWRAAREAYALFQCGARPDELPPGYGDPSGGHVGWAYRLGPLGVLAPDLRSERTRWRVMGPDGHAWLGAALEELGDCAELLLVSSVPLANLNLSAIERLFVWLPGQQLYQDDLRDQWRSYRHRREWRDVVARLFDVAERRGTRITVLSGEIHLAARGVFERGPTRIHQLVSSGVVHSPSPRWVTWIFGLLARGSRPVRDGIRMRMLPLPDLGPRYLPARNWLALDWRADEGLTATWYPEGLPEGRLELGGPPPPRV